MMYCVLYSCKKRNKKRRRLQERKVSRYIYKCFFTLLFVPQSRLKMMIARSRAAPALRRSISSIPAVWKNSERARTIVWWCSLSPSPIFTRERLCCACMRLWIKRFVENREFFLWCEGLLIRRLKTISFPREWRGGKVMRKKGTCQHHRLGYIIV